MKKYILLFLFLTAGPLAFCNPPGGGCNPDIEDCDDGEDPGEEIPLDDGVFVLVAGAVLYGVVKLRTGQCVVGLKHPI